MNGGLSGHRGRLLLGLASTRNSDRGDQLGTVPEAGRHAIACLVPR
jgi:hypothetical protein